MSLRKPETQTKRIGVRLGAPPIAPIPIEWMGPPVWRLPSGKALAEFALQAGFLAPLLLGGAPGWRGQASGRSNETGLRRAEIKG